MINNKKIGIVILNYNDALSTLKILKQIRNYSAIDHIVIVDNLSPDGSYQTKPGPIPPSSDRSAGRCNSRPSLSGSGYRSVLFTVNGLEQFERFANGFSLAIRLITECLDK